MKFPRLLGHTVPYILEICDWEKSKAEPPEETMNLYHYHGHHYYRNLYHLPNNIKAPFRAILKLNLHRHIIQVAFTMLYYRKKSGKRFKNNIIIIIITLTMISIPVSKEKRSRFAEIKKKTFLNVILCVQEVLSNFLSILKT